MYNELLAYALVVLGWIVGGVIIGFLSATTAKMLDSWMDYGHILGGVRLWAAKKAVKQSGDEELGKSLQATLDELENVNFIERIQQMDCVYWKIAAKNFWFTTWVCIQCMAQRMNFILFTSVAVAVLIYDLSLWYYIILLWVSSIVFAHRFTTV